MVTSDSYAEQTRRLLADTKSELSTIETQIDELVARRKILSAEAEAYEVALQGYLRRLGKEEIKEPDWVKLLAGQQTHKDKLKAITRNKGGRIKVREATDILYTKGFIHAKKRSTAYAMVQAYLADMAEDGEFQKIAPGEYELIGAQQKFA